MVAMVLVSCRTGPQRTAASSTGENSVDSREEGGLPEVRAGYGISGLSILFGDLGPFYYSRCSGRGRTGEREGEEWGHRISYESVGRPVICEDAGLPSAPQWGCFLAAFESGWCAR